MLMRWQHRVTWVNGNEIESSCLGHVVEDMLASRDPGWVISLSEGVLLRRIAKLPRVVLVLIIAKCLEDALHGFIADGLLVLFVDGLPGHADSHSFWGGGVFNPMILKFEIGFLGVLGKPENRRPAEKKF